MTPAEREEAETLQLAAELKAEREAGEQDGGSNRDESESETESEVESALTADHAVRSLSISPRPASPEMDAPLDEALASVRCGVLSLGERVLCHL